MAAKKRGNTRRKRHDQEDGEPLILPATDTAVEIVPEEPPVPQNAEQSLFEELDAPIALEVRDDGLPALDSDLTNDQKREFVKLLDKEMPLGERAKQLCLLARLKGTKTAAVGLRAIQEINLLVGFKEDHPTEAGPMFVLPGSASIAIVATKTVEK